MPSELSVIGFDDIQSAALLGLSTVRQPLEDSGAQGAERLCALLRGETVRPQRQVLELQVMHRASTTRPGGGRGVPAAAERGPHGRGRPPTPAAPAAGPRTAQPPGGRCDGPRHQDTAVTAAVTAALSARAAPLPSPSALAFLRPPLLPPPPAAPPGRLRSRPGPAGLPHPADLTGTARTAGPAGHAARHG